MTLKPVPVSQLPFSLQSAFLLNPPVFFFSPSPLLKEETYSPKPETDEMNEVEVVSVPDEKHIWVQPRVVRPTKPKKEPAVNYMSESGLRPLPRDCLCGGWGGLRGLRSANSGERGGV